MKLYEILLEDVTAANIADLYLIMVMPEPDSDAGKYVVRETTRAGAKEVTNTLESLILDEFQYVVDTDEYETVDDIMVTTQGDMPKILDQYLDARKEKVKKAEGYVENGWIDLERHLGGESVYNMFLAINEITMEEPQTFDSATEMANDHVNGKWNAKTFEVIFNKFHFAEEYGGRAWANITKHVNLLRDASVKQPKDFLLKFDRVIDIVHNTGELRETFITKGDPALAVILDVKAHAVDVRELRKFASPEIKKLFSDPNWRKAVLAQSETAKPGEERMTRGMETTLQRAFEPGTHATISPHIKAPPILDSMIIDGIRSAHSLETFYQYAVRTDMELFFREFEKRGKAYIQHIMNKTTDAGTTVKREAAKRMYMGTIQTRGTTREWIRALETDAEKFQRSQNAVQAGMKVPDAQRIGDALRSTERKHVFAKRMYEIFGRLLQEIPYQSPIERSKSALKTTPKS